MLAETATLKGRKLRSRGGGDRSKRRMSLLDISCLFGRIRRCTPRKPRGREGAAGRIYRLDE